MRVHLGEQRSASATTVPQLTLTKALMEERSAGDTVKRTFLRRRETLSFLAHCLP